MGLNEKYVAECLAEGFEYVGKSDRVGYSIVKCNVCGAVGEFQQSKIRRGVARCKHCHETKLINECLAEGFEYIGKSDRAGYSITKCMTCGTLDEFAQSAIRRGDVRCSACQIAKYQQSAKPGWTFEGHFRDGKSTYVNLKHNCSDAIVKVHVGHYIKGSYSCNNCQITKYIQSAKPGWTFINHFCDGSDTFVNLKHSCCEDLVKVRVWNFINGSYSCPHCSHSHFSDPSFFYVIQVGDIIKLGISNRPDQRYTQYGLPDDATIIEHLRIPLENKRDALVVESYAKQLVKDFKIPTEISKQVFTKEGFNECFSLESLDLLLSI